MGQRYREGVLLKVRAWRERDKETEEESMQEGLAGLGAEQKDQTKFGRKDLLISSPTACLSRWNLQTVRGKSRIIL